MSNKYVGYDYLKSSPKILQLYHVNQHSFISPRPYTFSVSENKNEIIR